MVAYLKRKMLTGTYNGHMTMANRIYTDDCKATYPDGTILLLTRDTGYHTSGCWKNPDYERCVHLSLSFRDPVTGDYRPKDKALSAEWVELMFGPTKNLVWAEPPYGPEEKQADVWHYRVFYAEKWVAPILPRGEVYDKTWTPAGWLSYSDVLQKEKDEVNTWLNQH